jgi:hypothetical protein
MVRHRQDPKKSDAAMAQVQELSIDMIKAKLAQDSPQCELYGHHYGNLY